MYILFNAGDPFRLESVRGNVQCRLVPADGESYGIEACVLYCFEPGVLNRIPPRVVHIVINDAGVRMGGISSGIPGVAEINSFPEQSIHSYGGAVVNDARG